MPKDARRVEEKMRERMSTAGKYHREGLEAAPDPIDILLSNPDKFVDIMVKRITDALKGGSWVAGLKKAAELDKWKKKIDIAARRYEEATDTAVENYMADYNERMKCIEEALAAIEKMPKATRADRIRRSAEFQIKVAECFDRLYGRKKS